MQRAAGGQAVTPKNRVSSAPGERDVCIFYAMSAARVCPNPLFCIWRGFAPTRSFVCGGCLYQPFVNVKNNSSFPNVWENQIMFKREAKRQQHRFQSLAYHLKICLNARSIILECLRSLFNVWPNVLEICFQSPPIYL